MYIQDSKRLVLFSSFSLYVGSLKKYINKERKHRIQPETFLIRHHLF